MTIAPTLPTPVPDDAAKIRMQGSATRLALPIMYEANHLLGFCLGGMRFAHWCDDSDDSGTYRYQVDRHPNCDYLLVTARVSDFSQSSGTITVTAGTGAAQARTVYDIDETHEIVIVAPWGASDSGIEEVTVAVSDLGIEAISCWDLQKLDFQSGDDYIAERDATYSAIGMHAGKAVAQSATAGVDGMIDQVNNAEDYCRRNLTGWSSITAVTVQDTSYANPWGAFVWRHNANAKRASGTTNASRNYYVSVYCKTDSGDYRLRASCVKSGATVTEASSPLSNTSYAWQHLELPVWVADCTIELEAQGVPVEGATPIVSIQAVSIVRVDD